MPSSFKKVRTPSSFGLNIILARGERLVKIYLPQVFMAIGNFIQQCIQWKYNLGDATSFPPVSLVPNWPIGMRRLMLLDPT